ncbi:MAG: alpha/beta hydrolase family protein [Lachnospiraceae bacterium]
MIKYKRIIYIVLFLISFVVVSFIITHVVYSQNFVRVEMPEYTDYDDQTGYDRELVEFKSGENTLQGYIYGDGNDKGLVVIAHGLGGGAESYITQTVQFVDAGWKVFSYDCTGSYRSEGTSTKGLPQSALDLHAALTYVEGQDWNLPIMLYGHSWGGYAVTAVLGYDYDITAVVSVAGYATPLELLDEQAEKMMGWFSHIIHPFLYVYQKCLFGDAADLSAIDGINNSDLPVMIIHGTEDTEIKYDGAAIIAHKDEINNPNVVYKICDTEGFNGHRNLVISEDVMKTVNQFFETNLNN